MAQETATEKKTNPILPFIKIPEGYPKEEAYLWGVKCGNCGSKFLGASIACGKCGAQDKFEEVNYGDDRRDLRLRRRPPEHPRPGVALYRRYH